MKPGDRFSVLKEDEFLDPSLSRLQHTLGNLGSGFRRLWWTARKIAASKQRSGSHSVIVPYSPADVKGMLRKSEYEPCWWLSYSFRGEVINRRRPIYHQSKYAKWWQEHIRGYQVAADDRRLADPQLVEYNDGVDFLTDYEPAELTDLTCHIEPEPKEHPDIHLKYVKYNDGTRRLLKLLERNGIPYVFIPENLQPEPIRSRVKEPTAGVVGSRVDRHSHERRNQPHTEKGIKK